MNIFFFFFFFFESTLFPIMFIVLGWGSQVERVNSGFYLFFYTLFSSIPMLLSIFFLFNLNNSLFLSLISLNNTFFIMYLFLLISFLVKMPMFLVHSWLPKAHVEAPVSGSMVLAGVLLKMGGYGIFRLSMIYKYFIPLNSMFMSISIWGGLLSSMICMRQSDFKSLVAYSSVSHMSLTILGFFIYSDLSICGSIMLMFAHGLCSSCLFFLINVVYERSGTRSIFLNKSLTSMYPSLSMWWFIFCSFNMGAPPSLNLISEILLISSIMSWSFFFLIFLMIFSFVGGMYNLYMYMYCNHGKVFSSYFSTSCCKIIEYLVILKHFIPLSFFFLKFDTFI